MILGVRVEPLNWTGGSSILVFYIEILTWLLVIINVPHDE
jgi:hypothetical protein